MQETTLRSDIEFDIRDGVATITLNRPDRLNAWTPAMADQVRHAVGQAGSDPAVRVIVITGAGRGFCAGADMASLDKTADRGKASGQEVLYPADVSFPDAPGPDLGGLYPGRFGYLYDCPKPVIAAINGPCAGIGLILTLYCDLRFAAEDARFSTAFAARGLIAEHGIGWLLPRLVGEAHALDLLMTSRKFTGAEAERMGMVNAALPADRLMAHVAGVASGMAHGVSPRAMAIMKRQVRLAYTQSFADALKVADAEMAASFQSDDFREGVKSYVERRAPQFSGI
ncbi:MAG: enoyl-CoA hydratase [Paracoccus sp. (in: a-proteobacteria)]|uniref:enoyl-CoA hydratase n=1 Tax=Paracoccus sp. TaxID=267 RepID=UPI003918DEE4